MSSKPSPAVSSAAPSPKAAAATAANLVATIFGGANLNDLFTQQGIHDVLNWKNPVLSTFFFLFANLCLYIIFYGNYSLISVACYLAMVHLVVTFSLCQIGHFMAKFQSQNNFALSPALLCLMLAADVELPPAQQTIVRVISEDAATAAAKTACSYINKAISLYQRATDGSSASVSVVAAILLFFTARVFTYLSLLRIAYLAFLWITLRPLVRKYFSAHIDRVHDIASRFVNAIISSGTAPAPSAQPVQAQAVESKKEM